MLKGDTKGKGKRGEKEMSKMETRGRLKVEEEERGEV